LSAPGGRTVWDLPLAVNIPDGRYTVEVVDVPTGARSTRTISVR
jgi:hypothetical protein